VRTEYGNYLVEQTFVNNLASRIIQTRLEELLDDLRQKEQGPIPTARYLALLCQKAAALAPKNVEVPVVTSVRVVRTAKKETAERQQTEVHPNTERDHHRKGKRKLRCFNCGSEDHLRNKCPKVMNNSEQNLNDNRRPGAGRS